MPANRQVDLVPGHVELDGDPAATIAVFSAHVYCGQTVVNLSYCWALIGLEPVGG